MVPEMSLIWLITPEMDAIASTAAFVSVWMASILRLIFGRFRGFLGQFLDFVGDDGKALARFPGAGGFDGRIQGEQVRLLRDGGDDLDDLSDFSRRVAEFGNGGGGGSAT